MEPTAALGMGCSRSKVVGEQIVTPAWEAGDRAAYSVRIGQGSGHSERGLWLGSDPLDDPVRPDPEALPDLNVSCS